MEQLFEFAANHWLLSSAWVILLILLLLSYSKSSSKMLGVQQATLLINRENATVIDIRAKADFNKGHILGSVNIPTSKIEEGAKGLPKDKTKPLLLVCQTGVTTAGVAQKLQQMGYENLYRLQGGIGSWSSESLPLEKS